MLVMSKRVYIARVETKMKALFMSLSEKDRRRYAAVEAEKLGHGGIDYISRLFKIDPKTIRQGIADLEGSREQTPKESERKKGVVEKAY